MNGQAEQPQFNEDQLKEALYHAVDITDRCLLPFILLGDTARSIQNNTLEGDGIYLGIRQADVTDGVQSMLRTLSAGADLNLGIQGFNLDEIGYSWIYHGVPISLQIIQNKYKEIENPDYVWFWGEEYKIPNPFEKYWQERDQII